AYDAALILQSVVGLIQLDSLRQLIADATQNLTVTAYDASRIARYAVGLRDSSSCLGEWHFNPSQRNYSAIGKNYIDQNFTAFLLGDVDGSWRYPDSVSVLRKVDFPIVKKEGDRYSIPIEIAPNKNLISLELMLRYATDQIEYVDIEQSELTRGFQIITNVQQGKLNLALFGAQPLIEGGALFNLVFQATDNFLNSKEIIIDKFQINNEPSAGGLILLENEIQHQAPALFQLNQNYPNPFNNRTTITLSVKDFAHVKLAIYNLSGDLVKVLVDQDLPADNYQFNWDGTDDRENRVTSGVYLCRAVQQNEMQSVKLIYIK
ncbi:MAG: T9SS type A sorting domain-containing protein, partial [bacterium]|nr:T9SS type A sorting domain-containing protein [bacterium]